MTDGDGLLAAILARPADDTPRLVYADYLDDHGEPIRAEFIRLSVAIAVGMRTGARAAKIRAKSLFDQHKDEWFPITGPRNPGWMITLKPPEPWVARLNLAVSHAVVKRGFVTELHVPSLDVLFGGPCPACENRSNNWCAAMVLAAAKAAGCTGRLPGLARELFSRNPITAVTTREIETWSSPVQGEDGPELYAWWVGCPTNQFSPAPPDVYTAFDKPYHAQADALLAVSNAIVNGSRKLAGLEPLS